MASTDELTQAVVGVNPNTGAAPGLVEAVGDDKDLAVLTLALRAMPVGSFQPFNADLRSVEASVQAARRLKDLFDSVGIKLTATATDVEQLQTNAQAVGIMADVRAESGRSKDASTLVVDDLTESEHDANNAASERREADKGATVEPGTRQQASEDATHVATGSPESAAEKQAQADAVKTDTSKSEAAAATDPSREQSATGDSKK